MSIKDIIRKNDKLYYLIYCISKVNSKRFRERVLTIRTNPYSILFDHYGTENEDKVYYDIIVGDETKGFCSAIRDTLYYLMYADALGFVPYIRYTDNIPYHEINPVNGKDNVFEYYFEQPSGIAYSELLHSSKVAHAESVHLKGNFTLHDLIQPTAYYSNENFDIAICAEMYKKYIKPNSVVETKLQNDIENLLPNGGKKVLGVHYRGTDFKVGYNGHPVAVQYQKHIDAVEKLMNTGKYNCIFLATEDGDIIESFQAKFGEKLYLYSDVVRGTGETNAYNMKNARENHHYLLGYEVMRDYYTLAACDAFVTSMSGVGITTQILKRSKGAQFDTVVMLEAGINKSNKVLQKNKY